MHHERQKNDLNPAPQDGADADMGAGSRTSPLHHKTHQERLAYWDEWNDRDRERMGRDPQAGPALRHLQRAEQWLNESMLAVQGCPAPERLFLFAGPQSSESMDDAEREEIRAHIAICETCAQEVASLGTPPPAPLLLEDADWSLPEFLEPKSLAGESRPGPTSAETPRSSTDEPLAPILRGPSAWRPFALSAAALLLVWFLAAKGTQPQTVDAAWPEVEVLRSAPSSASSHPHGRVLGRTDQGHWSGVMETTPIAGASQYVLRLYAHDGSAFDRGEQVAEWSHADASFATPDPLPAGHYTAEFFAILNGLEQPLPIAEFEVRPSPATVDHLHTLQGVQRVHYLFTNGWVADARSEALNLPDSEQRTAFLRALSSR